MSRPHVFILGNPRTGTQLTMDIIGRHRETDYHIADEIQFFGHSTIGRILLRRPGVIHVMRGIGPMSNDDNIRKLVETLYSGRINGVHWQLLSLGRKAVPAEKLIQALLKCDRSDRAIYETMISTQEREHSGYGDKSGPSVYHVDKLMKWFPDAKIIQTFRDPGALLASQHKKLLRPNLEEIEESRIAGDSVRRFFLEIKKRLKSIVLTGYVTFFWLWGARLYIRNSARYGDNHYLLVRFEDLIGKPRETIEKICTFLEWEFDPAMMNPQRRDSSYTTEGGTIKPGTPRGEGFDERVLERWKTYLTPWMRGWLSIWEKLFAGKYLKHFGYK